MASASKDLAVDMAADGDEKAPVLAAGDSVDLPGAEESKTGKRKSPEEPIDEKGLETIACEKDSSRISGEYCEENKKQRVELECLTKQVQELKAKEDQGFGKDTTENNAGPKLDLPITADKDIKGRNEDVVETMLKLTKDVHKMIEEIRDLKEENDCLVQLNHTLIIKDRVRGDELENAQRTLAEGFEKYMPLEKSGIGIKRIGELDETPFKDACQKKHGDDDPEGKAASLVSLWDKEVQNTSWHPFRVLNVDGETVEIVDDDDAKLKQLHAEYGDDVCNTVKVALAELNKYNPSGRYIIHKLWNFGERRPATMTDALNYIFDQLKKK